MNASQFVVLNNSFLFQELESQLIKTMQHNSTLKKQLSDQTDDASPDFKKARLFLDQSSRGMLIDFVVV